jgi:hypothetical protein
MFGFDSGGLGASTIVRAAFRFSRTARLIIFAQPVVV